VLRVFGKGRGKCIVDWGASCAIAGNATVPLTDLHLKLTKPDSSAFTPEPQPSPSAPWAPKLDELTPTVHTPYSLENPCNISINRGLMKSDLTILLAEDSEDDVTLVRMALERAGITNPLHVCHDGEEVVAYLSAQGPYTDRQKYPFPRLLILDLKMPKMNGLDVLRWLRAHPACSVIPTLVLSSSELRSDVQEAYSLGANAFAAKPSGLRELGEFFKNFLVFWSQCKLPDLPQKC